MKNVNKKLFSINFDLEDLELLREIKQNLRLSTTQQIVKYLIYNPVSLSQMVEKSRKEKIK